MRTGELDAEGGHTLWQMADLLHDTILIGVLEEGVRSHRAAAGGSARLGGTNCLTITPKSLIFWGQDSQSVGWHGRTAGNTRPGVLSGAGGGNEGTKSVSFGRHLHLHTPPRSLVGTSGYRLGEKVLWTRQRGRCGQCDRARQFGECHCHGSRELHTPLAGLCLCDHQVQLPWRFGLAQQL